MKSVGIGLLCAGIIIMAVALFVGPSVETAGEYGLPERIYNLARAQFQTLAFNGGGLMFLAGSILFAIGRIAERLEEVGVLKPTADSLARVEAETLTDPCEWCSRQLLLGSRTCSSWPADTLEEAAPKVTDPICIHHLHTKGLLA